uniref:hypothetical protein n=1 Tax=Rhodococcus qingshengii TaxID=334542 RepID=UPI001C4DFACB
GDAGIDLAAAPNAAPVLRISGDDKTLVPQVSLLAANFDGYWAGVVAPRLPRRQAPQSKLPMCWLPKGVLAQM